MPASIITAIIGVETRYGAVTGRYRALDALTTLTVAGLPRSAFFGRELRELLLLGREERLDLTGLNGSYAGALGLPQFIPSSYRAYAVDFDQDGRRDLLGSPADAIGSVANYLRRHGWEAGQPITAAATVTPAAASLGGTDPALKHTVSQLLAGGVSAPRRGARLAQGGADPPGGRAGRRVPPRFPELLRHHPLQPQPAVRDGGHATGGSHRCAAPGRTLNPMRCRLGWRCCWRCCWPAAPVPAPGLGRTTARTARPPRRWTSTPSRTPCRAPKPLCQPCLRPYEVEGVAFRPLASAAGYQARGIASWYGREFDGRPTANGERYDMLAMTAAHPTLPIPSYVRVTHLGQRPQRGR